MKKPGTRGKIWAAHGGISYERDCTWDYRNTMVNVSVRSGNGCRWIYLHITHGVMMTKDEIKPGYDRVTDVVGYLSGIYRVPTHILKAAAERGSFVHRVCDSIIDDMMYPQVPQEYQGYIDSFQSWFDNVMESQHLKPATFIKPDRFYCDELRITGECDLIIQRPDRNVLIDFKTSTSESKSWVLQGTAYCYLARKDGIQIDEMIFVKLDKNGNEPECYTYEEDFDLFTKCLQVYRHFEQ